LSTDPNPYASPTASDGNPESTPRSPKVIGILSILFGVVGLLSGVGNAFVWAETTRPVGGAEQVVVYDLMSREYVWVTTTVGIASSLAVLIAGVGLVKYRRWGRHWFFAYAAVAILASIANAAYMVGFVLPRFPVENAIVQTSMYVGAVAGAFGGCLYPAICLVFLLKPRVASSLR